MFFTPFAFIQQPYAVSIVTPPLTLQGYYIGGDFTGYSLNTSPYFRMLDSSGSLSSSFNIGSGFNGSVQTVATQSDGKIVAAGAFGIYSGSSSIRIISLNANGTKDTTFNIGATVFNNTVNKIAIQSDRKIVVGGLFSAAAGSGGNRIARINTNGTADTGSTWNTGAGFGNSVQNIAIQSDGKIVVVGDFTSYSGSTKNYIARLNISGSVDTGSTWNQGGGMNGSMYAVSIQSDGKIIAGGTTSIYSGSSTVRLVRINTDGTKDTTLNIGAGPGATVYSTAIQPDGKILIGGTFTTYSGSTKNYIARLNISGSVDTGSSWNQGTGFNSTVYTIAIQPDNKILVYGNFNAYSGSVANGVVRLNTDGTLDTSFNRDFSINNSTIRSALLALPNGSIIVGGNFTGNLNNVATFMDSTGSVTYRSKLGNNGFNLNYNATTFATQSDGKLLIGGSFTYYSGSNVNYIARIDSSSTLDTSFKTGAGFNNSLAAIVVQNDNKVVVGGVYTTYSGSTKNYIARLNTNGTADTGSSWNQGTGFNNLVSTLALQNDGKILVGGQFTTYSGSGATRIARLNVSGTLDTGSTWNTGAGLITGSGASTQVNTIVVQPDGKILVGGNFTTYSGSGATKIARINTNGTADTGSTWNTGAGFSGSATSVVNIITLQDNGKILVGGNFTGYSGSGATRIARINTDGTADTGSTWNTGAGFNSDVYSISFESNSGNIIVGGNFTTYSGSSRNRIVRLTANGTVDTTFMPTGSGFNNSVRVVLPIYSSSL